MMIDGYRFGWIEIDGQTYRQDVLLLSDRVVCPWWRKRGGHVFDPDDLGPLLAAGAEVVVLGTGALGRVRAPRETLAALENVGADTVVERTGRAVATFNRLVEQGRRVVAGLHLTC